MKTNNVFLEFKLANEDRTSVSIRVDKIVAIVNTSEREGGIEKSNIHIEGNNEFYYSVEGNEKNIVKRINLKLKEMF